MNACTPSRVEEVKQCLVLPVREAVHRLRMPGSRRAMPSGNRMPAAREERLHAVEARPPVQMPVVVDPRIEGHERREALTRRLDAPGQELVERDPPCRRMHLAARRQDAVEVEDARLDHLRQSRASASWRAGPRAGARAGRAPPARPRRAALPSRPARARDGRRARAAPAPGSRRLTPQRAIATSASWAAMNARRQWALSTVEPEVGSHAAPTVSPFSSAGGVRRPLRAAPFIRAALGVRRCAAATFSAFPRPRGERRRLQRAAVRERELPRVRARGGSSRRDAPSRPRRTGRPRGTRSPAPRRARGGRAPRASARPPRRRPARFGAS